MFRYDDERIITAYEFTSYANNAMKNCAVGRLVVEQMRYVRISSRRRNDCFVRRLNFDRTKAYKSRDVLKGDERNKHTMTCLKVLFFFVFVESRTLIGIRPGFRSRDSVYESIGRPLSLCTVRVDDPFLYKRITSFGVFT